jgi:hypothetical protein
MRLSSWRATAPSREAMSAKVLAVVEPVLASLGAEPDPHGWVQWGDDPSGRWVVLVPTAAGVVVCHVRVNVSGEGPRAAGKLVRWSRLQLGELAVETQGGHRVASFQVEGQVLRGADEQADAIAAFGMTLLAGVDGRTVPPPAEARRERTRTTTKRATTPPARGKPTAKPPTAPRPAAGAPALKPAARPSPRRSPGA